MHVDICEQIHRIGRLLYRNPVELRVLARGEVQEAAVELAADARQLAQLAAGQFAVGDRDAQHRRVALDVPAVLQAQRTEFVVAQLAGEVALQLIAELCSTGVYKLAVEFGVLVHRCLLVARLWQAPWP